LNSKMFENNLFNQRVQILTGEKVESKFNGIIINIPPRYGQLLGGKNEELYMNYHDVANLIHNILSRNEEYGNAPLDKWGRFDHDKSYLVLNKLDQSPIIDELTLFICRQLKLKIKNLWPDGKKAAVCLTHDVDQFEGRTFLFIRKMWWAYNGYKALFEGNRYSYNEFMQKIIRWSKPNYDPTYAFDNWMELEDKYGFKSTFFFFGLDHALSREGRLYSFRNKKVRQTIRDIDDKGWEIGLHAGYFDNLKIDTIRNQKVNLEDSLGKKIMGCRHHFLRVRFPESWKLYEAAGFHYSANMGWGNGNQGFRAGTSIPYKPMIGHDLLEIPFQLMDVSYLKNPTEYYGLFVDYLQKIKNVGGCLVIDFHQQYFDEVEAPGVNKAYKMILETLAEDKNVWVARLKDVMDCWTKF
jgi:peptidoglycan/xylan/chitin deacetylase (PgdA/CDA1 family)